MGTVLGSIHSFAQEAKRGCMSVHVPKLEDASAESPFHLQYVPSARYRRVSKV